MLVIKRMVKKIFVVDDDKGVLYTVKHGLESIEKEKYDIVCFDNAEMCLATLKNFPIPDLIILDIMMPGMNGWELERRIRAHPEWNKIPIVFLTATADESSKITGKSIEADFLAKPFQLPDLKKRIDALLQ